MKQRPFGISLFWNAASDLDAKHLSEHAAILGAWAGWRRPPWAESGRDVLSICLRDPSDVVEQDSFEQYTSMFVSIYHNPNPIPSHLWYKMISGSSRSKVEVQTRPRRSCEQLWWRSVICPWRGKILRPQHGKMINTPFDWRYFKRCVVIFVQGWNPVIHGGVFSTV